MDDDKPCTGLDPDTDPCPICGAWLSDPCPNDPQVGTIHDDRQTDINLLLGAFKA